MHGVDTQINAHVPYIMSPAKDALLKSTLNCLITPRAYALAGLSDCFCPSVSLSVCLSVNNMEIPFKVVS